MPLPRVCPRRLGQVWCRLAATRSTISCWRCAAVSGDPNMRDLIAASVMNEATAGRERVTALSCHGLCAQSVSPSVEDYCDTSEPGGLTVVFTRAGTCVSCEKADSLEYMGDAAHCAVDDTSHCGRHDVDDFSASISCYECGDGVLSPTPAPTPAHPCTCPNEDHAPENLQPHSEPH